MSEAIKENRAYLYVNKEVQRVSKKALEELDQKDVIVIFSEERKTNKLKLNGAMRHCWKISFITGRI